MDVKQFIQKIQAAPYVENGNSHAGLDCFGLVELWHKQIFSIDIDDRNMLECSGEGFNAGYQAQKDWKVISEPLNHCVVIMKSFWDGTVQPYGHCGIFYDGSVYHTDKGSGFQVVSIKNKRLLGRISALRIHKGIK